MNNYELVALLPMKGHSERVPNKNIRLFSGEPLFTIVLDSLLNSQFIAKVVINTDSEDIISIITDKYNDEVILHKRPDYLCGDFVPMNQIIKYDINKFNSIHYIQTHSTNPLVQTNTFDKAITKYFSDINSFDSLFAVNRLQTRLFSKQSEPINHNLGELIRTQDLDPIFEENSNFYIFSKTSFNNSLYNRIGLKPNMFEVNKLESQDIDDEEDFILAETLYKTRSVYYEYQEKTT